jgi:hypothetical protein
MVREVRLGGKKKILVNIAPARVGTIAAHDASILVTGGDVALEVLPCDRIHFLLTRHHYLYIRHEVTCGSPNEFDPAFIAARNAANSTREDRRWTAAGE